MLSTLTSRVPESVRATWKIRAFSLLKIPTVAFLGPKVISISREKLVLKIPLGYRSKNHLNSMYFGAIAVGCDLCVGILALKHIDESGKKLPIVFKDVKIDFLKRAESDVHFICEEGEKIDDLIQRVCASEERISQTFNGYATCPDTTGDEPVAKFEITLSLKQKKKKPKLVN